MKRTMPLIVILCCTALIATSAGAQVQSISDSTARALKDIRRAVERDRRMADSLRAQWERQWRISDSLRVESMLLRMRSDSLKRSVAAAERRELEMLQSLATTSSDMSGDSLQRAKQASSPAEKHKPTTDPLNASQTSGRVSADTDIVERAVRANRKGRVSPGRTLSDTITARVLMVEPDTGMASYYADAFHGRRTSSGEIFDMHDRTCAHRWLPFNTKLLVTNLANGREVVVRVTDRGPWKKTRILDLSKQAAIDLDMIRAGTARVSIRVYDDSLEPVGSDTTGSR